jgi:steroid 5-alpha reductase family enzyme
MSGEILNILSIPVSENDLMLNMVLIGWLCAALVMFVLWIIHLRLNNAGVVDIGWAGSYALIALVYYVMGDGYGPRRALITTMAVVWGVRLTIHLIVRTVGHEEDGRYQQIRKDWGGNLPLKFFFFFQFQAVLDVILSVPLLLVSINPKPELSILEWLGFGLWIIAVAGESAADRQLQAFKSDPANKGKVCNVGLWRYSRHPNYFFEWLIWVALFVFASASPDGFISIICPALMLYFLLRVTGIPATEAQSLRSKGDAYREYQRTTSVFVPWFPRKS